MADQFLIRGGSSLNGEVTVSGAKNAAVALIPAALLTNEECVLENVPRIEDVERLTEILRSIGAEISWEDTHTLRIRAGTLDPGRLDQTAIKRLRASVLLIGPLLARTGRARTAHPGGCFIGARPIDTHIEALEALGATVTEDENVYDLRAPKLRGAVIVLREFSVTATENVLMAAALAEGKTRIHIAAAEPHVADLARFLNKMGARIRGAGTHDIEITGVRALRGARHRIVGDYIEAGTFAAAFAATHGSGVISGIDPRTLELPLKKLNEAGIPVQTKKNAITVERALHRRAIPYPGVQTLPYPGFPSDLQAPFCVLATQLEGATSIQETIYEGRLRHIDELRRMGANAVITDPHHAVITGPTPLYGTEIQSLDLRAGATLVIAALVAEGESAIHEVYNIDRGYERIEEKLQRLGADITRINEQ